MPSHEHRLLLQESPHEHPGTVSRFDSVCVSILVLADAITIISTMNGSRAILLKPISEVLTEVGGEGKKVDKTT
jgi:hypothetical protein